MDVVGAREELSLIDWEEELKGTVNESWESLKDILFRFRVSTFRIKPKVERRSCG